MNLAPGMRTPEGRPGLHMAMLLILAGACAALANAFAGPTRHLAWRPAPPPRPATAAPAPAPAPTVPPPSVPKSEAPPASKASPAIPTAARVLAPKSLQDLYPAPPTGAPFEIEDAEALALHRAGALFLDARRTSLYEEGHIAGSRSFSYWEDGLDAKLQVLADTTFDFKDPVVIYCSGGDCRDSHDLADRMWPLGFRNLRIFKGGWPAWKAMGGPSAQGREVVK